MEVVAYLWALDGGYGYRRATPSPDPRVGAQQRDLSATPAAEPAAPASEYGDHE